tara:strand:+ start:12795 stop:12947 length:153 start_codon:yes stop_codon:yes gene_type:complete
MSWQDIHNQAIIGLVSVALAYIDKDEIEKAEDTLRGIIMQLDGTSEAVGE